MKKVSVASHYKGEAGEKYSKGRGQDEINHLGYKLQARFFLPYLSKNMHVLEFGCGNGSMAKVIEPNVKSIEAIEVNAYARDIATNKQQLTVYDSIDKLPALKRYDAIISNHVLEHVPNVIDTLSIIYENLLPGGLFITMLPIDDFREKTNKKWNANDMDHHLHTWTPLLFGNTLSESGFIPKELKVISYAWSQKLFFLGDSVFLSIACKLLSIFKKRRQLFVVAIKDDR